MPILAAFGPTRASADATFDVVVDYLDLYQGSSYTKGLASSLQASVSPTGALIVSGLSSVISGTTCCLEAGATGFDQATSALQVSLPSGSYQIDVVSCEATSSLGPALIATGSDSIFVN